MIGEDLVKYIGVQYVYGSTCLIQIYGSSSQTISKAISYQVATSNEHINLKFYFDFLFFYS